MTTGAVRCGWALDRGNRGGRYQSDRDHILCFEESEQIRVYETKSIRMQCCTLRFVLQINRKKEKNGDTVTHT